MEKSVGMIVAMNEVTQNASKTGNALKTISSNMAGVSVSAKDGTLQTNKTAKALKEIAGIDVWNKQTGEIKDMYTVMDELNGKWGDLSEAQRNALATTIAGKTQLNTFNALMSNWGKAKQLVSEYKQGLTIGSAEKENLQYLDSIQGKWNAIKENLKSVTTSLISSDFVKGALDGIEKITSAIAKLASTKLGQGALFAGLIAGVSSVVKAFSRLKDAFKIFDVLKKGSSIGEIAKDFAKLPTSVGKTTSVVGKMGTAIKTAVSELGLFASAGATATTLTAAGFLSLPFAIAGYVKYQEYATKKRMENSRQTIQSLKEEIDANKQAVESVRGIAEEYDVLNLKRNKTNEEQQRHLELTKQIAEAFPDLVSGYDEAGNPILALNGSLETYIRNLDRAIEKQNQLMKSEQNSIADEWKNQIDDFKKRQEELSNYKYPEINTNAIKDVFTGRIDPKKLKTQIDEVEKAEKKHYDNALSYYEDYEKAKAEVNQSYQNKLENLSGYKNSDDSEKQRVKDMMSNLDMYSLYSDKGETGTKKLMNALLMMDDKLVGTTEEMGKHAEAIDKAEEAYGNTGNLSKYTDELMKIYEASGKVDNESFTNLIQGIQDYVSTTGDLEGANRQVEKIATTLSKISGIDSSIWESALKINVEPLEVAEQKLNSFLKAYNTSGMNIGKGGLADKMKMEFENMADLPTMLANELEANGTISAEFLLEATVDMPTPIQELVKEIVADGEVDEEEIEILIEASTEIRNEGEISSDLKEKIKSKLNISDEEFETRFTVKADIEAEAEIDDFLNSINAGNDVEFAIRCNVEGRDEAEALWQSLQSIPEEKRLQVVANYGEVKEAARQLGIDISNLPTQTIVDIATNVDNAQLETFLQAIEGIDGKTVSAFLQADGAAEALAQCETVQQMLDLINTFIATGKIEIENEGEEETETTKQSLEELDGKQVVADLLVQSDEGNLEQTKSALVEIDGKTYLAAVNVDTNETELVPFEGKLNELDGKTVNSTVNVNEGNTSGIIKGKEVEELPDNKRILVDASAGDTSGITKGKEVETLPDNKDIKVNASTGDTSGIEKAKEVDKLPKEKEIKVSIVQKAGNVLDSISNFFKSKTEEKVSVSVQVTGKEQVESVKNAISSMQNKNISVNVNGNALSQVNQIKSALNGLQIKNISINANGNALSQINSIKSALNGIQTKNISINASGNALGQINSIKSALSGLQSKSISINASVGGAGAINALKASIAGLQGKSVSVTASASGTGAVSALTSAIGRVQGKSVSVAANVSGTGAVNSLVSAINKVKSKSVTISASVSGTGSVQSLASAIASVHSKSVTVSVTKTVTTVSGGDSGGMSSIPISATPMLSNTPLANIPVSLSATDDIPTVTASDIAPINVPVSISARNSSLIDTSKLLSSLDYDIDAFKNLEEALKRIANQLDLIDEKAKNSFGQEKIDLLRQQISLLKQQQQVQKQIEDSRKIEAKQLKKSLSSKGFTFDDNGSIKNYQNKLIAMEQNVESLKKKYDNLNDAKKKNETAIKKAQKAYDNANEELSKTKKYLNEYFEANNKADEASEKWYEYQNAIKEAEQAIRDAQNDPLRNRLDSLGGTLDYLEAKYKSLGNQDKIKNLKDQENIYEKQQATIGLLVEQLEKQLATMDKQSDEYKDTKEEIDELNKQWWDIEESINDVTNETKELNRQMKLLSAEAKFEELDELFTELQFKLDLINEKMEYAWGTDKIDAMRDSIGLLNGQLDLQQQKINSTNARLAIYQDSLKKYNFQFDARGNSTNYSEVLDSYKNSPQLEEIIDLYKEYKDTHEELQDQMIEYWKIENEIKDLQKEKLEITQDVEEEITKIIEKEYEKRKDEIEKYTDERIKLLEKEKQIYKDMRDEQEYQKSINEQTSEIEKINSLIATASRDTSIAGQKRLKELMEDLAEAQKELEEMTQDKIDDDYENNIDDEIDRLKEEQENLLTSLDEKFSETNIAKMVQTALQTGVIEIDGEVKSLQDALLQSINDSAEGYSVMADVIKNELVSNLNVALDTMLQIADINEKLDLQNFDTAPVPEAKIPELPTYTNNGKAITMGDTIINVNGSVDDVTLAQIEVMIKEENERMLKEITNGI